MRNSVIFLIVSILLLNVILKAFELGIVWRMAKDNREMIQKTNQRMAEMFDVLRKDE